MTAPADSSIPPKVLFVDHTFCFFLHFCFPFIIDNCNYGNLPTKCLKMKMFLLFPIVYSTYMLLRQFCLSNNLPTHIKENIDFFQQKSQQLLSDKANFEDCCSRNCKSFKFLEFIITKCTLTFYVATVC